MGQKKEAMAPLASNNEENLSKRAKYMQVKRNESNKDLINISWIQMRRIIATHNYAEVRIINMSHNSPRN